MATDLLFAAEAAERVSQLTGLRIRVRTFNRWAAAGRIRTAQKGPGEKGARLFAPKDVERLAKQISKEKLYTPEAEAAS